MTVSGVKHVPRLVLHWAAAEDGGYVARFEGEDWRLTPTPESKYPWLLIGAKSQTKQEIGEKTPRGTQQRAAMWLDITTRGHYPPYNRSTMV